MVLGYPAAHRRGTALFELPRDQWKGVPEDRFNRRAAYATQGAEEIEAQNKLLTTFAAPFDQVGNPELGLDGRPTKKAE